MITTRKISAAGRNKEAGSALLEGSLTLLVFLLLIIAICDFGQFLFIHQTITERVRGALRYGSVNPYDPTPVRNMVLYGNPAPPEGATPAFDMTADMVSVSRQDAGTQEDRLVVTVANYHYKFLTPYIAGSLSGLTISNTLTYEYQ
ncbi:MAG TPA: TadE/TadG family type IV pilus assembly protein [Bryobacteraceae bacterium]|nr:TadE/TadG family type IV pilus assembly protein [Bryobacteraceae bacterium]